MKFKKFATKSASFALDGCPEAQQLERVETDLMRLNSRVGSDPGLKPDISKQFESIKFRENNHIAFGSSQV